MAQKNFLGLLVYLWHFVLLELLKSVQASYPLKSALKLILLGGKAVKQIFDCREAQLQVLSAFTFAQCVYYQRLDFVCLYQLGEARCLRSGCQEGADNPQRLRSDTLGALGASSQGHVGYKATVHDTLAVLR